MFGGFIFDGGKKNNSSNSGVSITNVSKQNQNNPFDDFDNVFSTQSKVSSNSSKIPSNNPKKLEIVDNLFETKKFELSSDIFDPFSTQTSNQNTGKQVSVNQNTSNQVIKQTSNTNSTNGVNQNIFDFFN